jgi:MFS family permease
MIVDVRMHGRGALVTVAAAYAVQGLGYAVMVTSLPSMKSRYGIDDVTISVLLLSVCLTAAVGSVLASRVAARRNSKWALLLGFALQSTAFVLIGAGLPFAGYVVGVVLFGVGLGWVDASSAMQGVLVQQGRRLPVLGRCFAAYTGAAIIGAVVMSVVLSGPTGVAPALFLVALVDALIIVVGSRLLPVSELAAVDRGATRRRIPTGPTIVVGTLIFAAFVADSAVSTWSSIYLGDTLHTDAATAPLGYAGYLAVLLISRLAVDLLSRRLSRIVLGVSALLLGIAGFAVVAAMPTIGGAIVGFALCGAVAGIVVPLAFGETGVVHPEIRDALIARVNLFNYLGALMGAVLTGLIGDAVGLGIAFLIPAAALVFALPAARRLSPRRADMLGQPVTAAR